MSYSNSNNATVDGLSASSQSSLAQGLANNTRVIAPPASTATQDANAAARVRQGVGARDLSAMTLGTSLTVNSDTLQQLQLRNRVATTFTGGGNIVRFANASITQETGLTANPDTAPGGPTPGFNATANANPWEADFTEAVAGTIVSGLAFTASTVDNRNIWDPTFQFSVPAAGVPAGGITYRVTTDNPGDGIDYVNVRNGTAPAGVGATNDTVTSDTMNAGAAVTTVPVTGGAPAYLGRNVLGLILTASAAACTVDFTDANGDGIGDQIAFSNPPEALTFNVAPLGFHISAQDANANTITLSNPTGEISVTVAGADLTSMVLIMGARFAVSDADGNDAVPSAPLVNGPIVFLQDQDAVAHYLDFGRDSNSNALRLHDAIFGNSHHRAENKSQLLSLSELAVNPGVDLFVGTSTVNAATGLITPAAADSAGVHVVFLTDLGQATSASDGNGNGRNANVQLIDSQDNTNFEVKLLAEWLADGSTTSGASPGTFPRMQFTRVQDGMASPAN